MKIIEIKELTPEIFKTIQELTQMLAVNMPIPLPLQTTVQDIIKSNNSHLFFIEEERETAGMLTVGIYASPTGIKAWIEDVVVSNKFRGRGFGRKITRFAIDFARQSGADTLMLTSNPSRIAANQLYRSLGFEKKETNVYRMIFNK